jgi:ADP-heptose:LPS heptosyltransferase
MTGKTTMRQLMMLYCLADALVTNDSGPAHFAALVRLPRWFCSVRRLRFFTGR